MSDSDEDLMPNSVLKYQHDRAAINATNFNNTNITSYTLRNNMMTSTFNMPHLERQRYGMRGFDQRSMYYRRETSPMSLRSFPDSGVQNFHNSFYSRGMSSQRSVFNGRSGSPVSMRSIDSNASVSAADIALALKNEKFNKYELRLIKEAYNKFLKNQIRGRIERRRNLKLFLKRNRRRSGEDSGEQGSDSSISSDDCRSSRAIRHKENMPKTTQRPLKTHDLTQFRSSMKESEMFKDCTENFKQSSLRNMFAVNSLSQSHTVQEKRENISVTLKERFTKGSSFLLPSQRFNKSKLISNDMSIKNAIPGSNGNKNYCVVSGNHRNQETDSEKEEIFSENTVRGNTTHETTVLQRKRILDTEEANFSERKRYKTAISPIKENDCSSINMNNQNNDFNFKKPKLPIRKISNVKKDAVPEILIAKSRQPLSGNLELEFPNNKLLQNRNTEEILESKNKEIAQNTIEIEPDYSNQSEVTQNTTDVSMKPSFLKRKLFTQKLDVAESKNISSDNLATNSPQTKIYSDCREKNKVRKLVSSQSCLSRDVLGDDNVLDLIHKIVPPDQMNITSATNKKELSKSNNDNTDKWDVASVISMCNNDEGSDTYTDEEIFKVSQIANKTNNKQVNKETDKPKTKECKVTEPKKQHKDIQSSKTLNTDCKVVIQKLQPVNPVNRKQDTNSLAEPHCQNKRTVSNCVKSFWDTDFESDMEDRTATSWTYQTNQGKDILHKDPKNNCINLNPKRNTLKGTILTVRSFHNKGVNSSVRSDISRVSKKKDIYLEKQEENNNKMVNKNTKTKQNEEKKAIDPIEPSKKTQKDSKLKNDPSKVNNVKPKPKQTKQTKNKKQQDNTCNTSRESIRLKQKREKAQNESNTQVNDVTGNKRGRRPNNIDNNDSNNKKNNTTKKSKETSNKDTKSVKNSTIKIATLNRTHQTPRKCNEKKQLLSSADQSSLNISNISLRSLRLRHKNVK